MAKPLLEQQTPHNPFQEWPPCPASSLTQPLASALLLVKDWLLCHGNGPSSEGSYQPVIFWSLYSILCPSSLA